MRHLYAHEEAQDYVLMFNGVGMFEIKGDHYYIPYDEVYGYECMQETDFNSFMEELRRRRHVWYDSWDKTCKEDYDKFYNYALATHKKD